MLTYLINLDRSTARLADVSAEFAAQGRDFTRVPAIAPPGDRHPACDHERFEKIFGRPIVRGEIGCALSHRLCAEMFLATGAKHCLVFEDDVKFTTDTFPTISAVVAALDDLCPDQWECVNLASYARKRRSKVASLGTSELLRSWQFPLLTSGLIWSRKGALKFLRDLEVNRIYAPVDNQLRYLLGRSGNGFSVSPSPVRSADEVSTIQAEPVHFRRRKNGWQSVKKRAPVYYHAYRNMLGNALGLN